MSNNNAKETDGSKGLFPVRGVWLAIGFYTLVFIWIGYIIREALAYDDPIDYLLPLVLGVPLLLLTFSQIVILKFPESVDEIKSNFSESTSNSGLKEEVKKVADSQTSLPKREKEKEEIYMMIWVIIAPIMMFYIGMGWTLIVYTFSFSYFYTRNLKISMLISIFLVAFIFVLFIYFLDLRIHNGVLGFTDPLMYLSRFI